MAAITVPSNGTGIACGNAAVPNASPFNNWTPDQMVAFSTTLQLLLVNSDRQPNAIHQRLAHEAKTNETDQHHSPCGW